MTSNLNRAVPLVGLLAAACTTSQPVRLRYAEGSTALQGTVTPTLAVFSSPAATSPAKARDFSERASASYIEALADKIAGADDFRAAVAAAVAPSKAGDADRTSLARTITLGIGKSGYSAGQRFIATRTVVIPIGFKFADFDSATSKYQTIDLETVSVSSTTTAKVGIAPEFGSTIEAAEASLSREDEAGTTYVNRAIVESLTADLQPDRLEIFQQSAPNEDLTGTVLISAAVRPVSLTPADQTALAARLGIVPDALPAMPVDPATYETVVTKMEITDKAGTLLPPGKSTITTAVNTIWRSRPLYVCAAMTYVERVPSPATARFFDEGRQVVTERSLALPGKLYLLVPAEEVAAPLWGVVGDYGALLIATDTKPQTLAFADPLQASRFAAWLVAKRSAAVGAQSIYTINSMGRQVSPTSVPGERYRVELLNPAGDEANKQGQPCSVPGINTKSGR
jgi:hypothetical protein